MSKLIKDLDYTIQVKAQKTYDEMNNSETLKALGVEKVAISETKRDIAVQMAYYSRSRMKNNDDVKLMYKRAGLYTPTDAECETANTWTLYSKHIDGKAIDLVPVKDGICWWTAPDEVWQEMGKIGKENGLTWGGDWTTPDKPHFEI